MPAYVFLDCKVVNWHYKEVLQSRPFRGTCIFIIASRLYAPSKLQHSRPQIVPPQGTSMFTVACQFVWFSRAHSGHLKVITCCSLPYILCTPQNLQDARPQSGHHKEIRAVRCPLMCTPQNLQDAMPQSGHHKEITCCSLPYIVCTPQNLQDARP